MTDFERIADKVGLPNHMKITVDSESVPGEGKASYSVLVNPESINIDHFIDYDAIRTTGTENNEYSYAGEQPQGMNLELLFDSTGSLGKIPLIPNQTVLEQIESFMSVAFVDSDQLTNPRSLYIVWGEFEFTGILASLSISYTHFDASGSPIRAIGSCRFIGGTPKFKAKPNQNAPLIDLGIEIDYAKFKHAINAIHNYGSYISVLSNQPIANMPKSLRLKDEIAKLIVK